MNATTRTEVLRLLGTYGERGVTWGELARVLETHHGAASGALSALHREGRISRLAVKRGGSKIYVLPQHVAGRWTERYGRNKSVPVDRARTRINDLIEAGGATPRELWGLLELLGGEQ